MSKFVGVAVTATCLTLLAACGQRIEHQALSAAHGRVTEATACAQVTDESLSNVRRGIVYRHDGQSFDPPAPALFATYHYVCATTAASGREQSAPMFMYVNPRTDIAFVRFGDGSAPTDTVLSGFN